MKHRVLILVVIAAVVIGAWVMNFLHRDSCHDYGGMWEAHRIGGICVGIETRQHS